MSVIRTFLLTVAMAQSWYTVSFASFISRNEKKTTMSPCRIGLRTSGRQIPHVSGPPLILEHEKEGSSPTSYGHSSLFIFRLSRIEPLTQGSPVLVSPLA